MSDVAAASGVPARTIRCYERRGLLDPVQRTASGHRIYSVRDVHILDFVRRSRELGLPVAEIAKLLDLWRNRQRASADVRALAANQIRLLSARAATLEALIHALIELADNWGRQGREDHPILRGLSAKSQPAAQTADAGPPLIGRGH